MLCIMPLICRTSFTDPLRFARVDIVLRKTWKFSFGNPIFSASGVRIRCRQLVGVAISGSLVLHNNTCYRSGIMSTSEKTISFRAVAGKIDSLDSLAAARRYRSRSYLINEAISNYIELHAYQDALVRKGLEEKRKGRVLSHEEVVKGLKRTGRARQ